MLSSVPKEVIDNHVLPNLDPVSLMVYRHTLYNAPLTRQMILGKESLIVRNGITVIEYFRNLGYLSDETVTYCAATNNQPEVLEYCLAHNYQWHDETCNQAVKVNSLPCLIIAQRTGCRIDETTRYEALSIGAIDCLNYLLKHRLISIYQGDIRNAIRGGYDCFAMVADILPNRNPDIRDCLVTAGDPNILTLAESLGYCVRGIAKMAIKAGKLAILKWLQEHYPIELTNDIFNIAAEHGHLDCLKYLQELGFVDPRVFNSALSSRSLDCVKYLASVGYSYDASSYEYAWNIECVKFLGEIGCLPSSDAIEAAIAHENLEVLKYLHHKKSPWPILDIFMFGPVINSSNVDRRLSNEQLDCIVYALKHGCPYDMQLMTRLLEIPAFCQRLHS